MLNLLTLRILSGTGKFTGAFFNAYFTRTITQNLVDFILILIALSALIQSIFYFFLSLISDKPFGKDKKQNKHLYIQSFLRLVEFYTQFKFGYKVSSIRNALCVESRTLIVFLSKLIDKEKRKKISKKQYAGVFIIFLVIILSSIFKDKAKSHTVKPKDFDSFTAILGLLLCGISLGLFHVHFDETVKKSQFGEKEYAYKCNLCLFLITLFFLVIQFIFKKEELKNFDFSSDFLKVLLLFSLNNISAVFLMFYFSNLGRMILQQVIKLISTTSVDLLVQRGTGKIIFPFYGIVWIFLSLVGALLYNNVRFKGFF
ncbi:hypothetical protein TUBRATIS_001360 [Tubulinosema ratisbonensis]|uniref:Uncharacterized protein n=1 Tax=Tubulinosema ratisbonensis TaxID=291195 RepID=A0A437AQ16_9MICR|nr:hypothetical protein TUBRATIS_001360 [Tubulinosema ratisbonensis]